MYRYKKPERTFLKSVETFEGETIEQKVSRIQNNGEPITDGAPEIFTERKDGVYAAYNIRTDRFEIAAEAMDKYAASIQAQRDGKGLEKEGGKVVDLGAEKGPENRSENGV